MPSAIVREILREINALNTEDQLQLHLELARRREQQWEKGKKLKKAAGATATGHNMTDKVIHRRRYGR